MADNLNFIPKTQREQTQAALIHTANKQTNKCKSRWGNQRFHLLFLSFVALDAVSCLQGLHNGLFNK